MRLPTFTPFRWVINILDDKNLCGDKKGFDPGDGLDFSFVIIPYDKKHSNRDCDNKCWFWFV
jgi:hypothetical protein